MKQTAKRFIDIDPHDFALMITPEAVKLATAKVRATNQALLDYEVVPHYLLSEFANTCYACKKPFEIPLPGFGVPVVAEIGNDDDRLYHPDCRPAYRWWHEVVELPKEQEEELEQLSLF